MHDIARRDFTDNLFKLLDETFVGAPPVGGSAYLDKNCGLLQTLDALTHEAASRPPFAGAPTIAAHCAHVLYYVRALHEFMVGQQPKLDWPGSWETRRVDAGEWATLKADLRAAYDELRATLESTETWGDDPVGDSMAIVVHTAYHLGAIRLALRAVAS